MKGYSDGALSAAKELAEVDFEEIEQFKRSEKIQKDLGRISQKITNSTYKSDESAASYSNSEESDSTETYSLKLSRDIASADYASEFANDDVVYEESNQDRSISSTEEYFENHPVEEINE